MFAMAELDYYEVPLVAEEAADYESMEEVEKKIEELRGQMKAAAERFEFEKAAECRDRIKRLQDLEMDFGGGIDASQAGR